MGTLLKTLVFVYAMVVGTMGTSIVGTVKDSNTEEKLPNVQVIINKTDTIYTDKNGEFTYLIGDSILKSVQLNHPDYEPKSYIYVTEEEDLDAKSIRLLKKEQRKAEREKEKEDG